MKRLLEKMRKKEEGAVLVLVAVLLTVLLGLTALAVDLGLAYFQRQRLQNACDAAALAAATALPNETKAKQLAYEYMRENGFSDSPSDVIVTFEGTPSSKVRVGSTFDVRANFAKFLGTNNMRVSCNAAAGKVEQKKSNKFPYLIFAEGGELKMGADYEIGGAVHTNGALTTNPGDRNPGSYMKQMSYGTSYKVEGHPCIRIEDEDYWVMTLGGGVDRFYFNGQTSDNKANTYCINTRAAENQSYSTVQGWVDNGDTNDAGNPIKMYAMSDLVEEDDDIILDRDYPHMTDKADAAIATLKTNATSALSSVGSGSGWATTTNAEYLYSNQSGSKTIVSGESVWITGKTATHTEPAVALKSTGTDCKFDGENNDFTFKDIYFYRTGSGSNKCGFTYTNKSKIKANNVYCNKDLAISAQVSGYIEINGNIYCDGDLTLKNVEVNGNIYATGNIESDSCKITGMIAAKGDISFIGTAPTLKCREANGRIACYSEEGNISQNGADASPLSLIGIMYAKKGNVTLHSRTVFYGNIIGKTVDASYKDIEGHPISDLPEFPEDGDPDAAAGAAKKYDIVLVE